MIKVNGIDHINMSVNNVEETISFYDKFFDFKVKEHGVRKGRPYAIIGVSNKAYLAIYQDGIKDVDHRVRHLGINVDNFDETYEVLNSAGLIDHTYEYPGSRSIYLFDPNGLEIEISEKFGGDLG